MLEANRVRIDLASPGRTVEENIDLARLAETARLARLLGGRDRRRGRCRQRRGGGRTARNRPHRHRHRAHADPRSPAVGDGRHVARSDRAGRLRARPRHEHATHHRGLACHALGCIAARPQPRVRWFGAPLPRRRAGDHRAWPLALSTRAADGAGREGADLSGGTQRSNVGTRRRNRRRSDPQFRHRGGCRTRSRAGSRRRCESRPRFARFRADGFLPRHRNGRLRAG